MNNSIDAKEVELVDDVEVQPNPAAGDDISTVRNHVAKNITCCNAWKLRGCFLFFLLVCVTVFFGIVLILSSYNMHGPFALLSRPWVWTFLVITIFYILQVLWIIVLWKKDMIKWIMCAPAASA